MGRRTWRPRASCGTWRRASTGPSTGPASGRPRGSKLTRTDTDRLFVRYLPPGVGVADKRPGFLTIASYPYPGAFKAVSASLKRPHTVGLPALNSGLVAWNTKRPTSVYFAARNSNVLVEVFSPRRNEARRLVLGGDVTPVR